MPKINFKMEVLFVALFIKSNHNSKSIIQLSFRYAMVAFVAHRADYSSLRKEEVLEIKMHILTTFYN